MTKVDWIRNKLLEYNLDAIEVSNLFSLFCKETQSTWSNKSFKREIYKIRKRLLKSNDQLLDSKTERLQSQRILDIERFNSKTIREQARAENSLIEYSKSILEILKKYDFSKVTICHEKSTNSKVGGVVHISDVHFNELVSIPGNRYDFKIAAKRLKKLAIQIKKYFSLFGVKNILLAFTGDLLNSNRRLDELLNQSTNRAQATMLSFFILEQFILDLNKDFNITIASVSGNESRIEKEMGYSDIISTDNFDIIIENILKIVFRNCPGVRFVEGSPREKLINVAGQNILILHGDNVTKNNQASIQQIAGNYAFKGILIDYVLYGHFHSSHISDFFARSSSIVGSNSYNEQELGLVGRSSQNIFIFFNNKNRDAIKIDLQNTENIQGYEIEKELESYNAKSSAKLRNYKEIIRI